MSGRHAGQSATRKRIVRVATVSAVAAVPLGVVAAGSAAADTNPLPVDTSSVTNLLGGALGGGGTGGITSAVTNALSGTPAAGVLSSVDGVASDTPAAGVLDMSSGSSAASPVSGLLSDTPASGLLSTVTGATSNTPVAGVLGTVTHGLGSGNPVSGLGGVVNGLGLQGVTGTLKPVTDTVNGLLDPVLGNGGLLGGLTGGLLGGLLGGDQPGNHIVGDGPSDNTGDDISNSALPHTGGNSDMTALLLCTGLGLAGAGVTLVARRRGGIGA